MNDPQNRPLNSAQIQAIEKVAREKLDRTIGAIELRRWCIEKAMTGRETHVPVTTIIEAADAIYAFVAKPALEFKIEA